MVAALLPLLFLLHRLPKTDARGESGPLRPVHTGILVDWSPGHLWRVKWTALSGPLSRRHENELKKKGDRPVFAALLPLMFAEAL